MVHSPVWIRPTCHVLMMPKETVNVGCTNSNKLHFVYKVITYTLLILHRYYDILDNILATVLPPSSFKCLSQFSVEDFDLPAQNPDLSTTQHLWDEHDRRKGLPQKKMDSEDAKLNLIICFFVLLFNILGVTG